MIDAMDATSVPAAPATPPEGRGVHLRLSDAVQALRTWPWFQTLRTLRARFREDHLGLTAGSLTFTTLIALVPLVTVMLAVFSIFPMFSSFQVALEKYFLQSLVPDGIAKPVLAALTQFAGKANRLGSAGLVILLVTALALMLTIDRTLNAIWRVRRPRPIGQRVLVYWAALTLGPLLLGVSLTFTSYALSASRGLVASVPGGVGLLLDIVEFTLLAAAMTGLFRYVPNAPVRWRHALAGGLFVAVAFEFAKRTLAWYLKLVPSYSTIYGAFATAPILLLWVYVGWVIVLLGAVVAAYAPSLSMQVTREASWPGQGFTLALRVIGRLDAARVAGEGGLDTTALARALRIDPLQVESSLAQLIALGWAGRLDEDDPPRYVLLCEPASTPAAPLVERLLLARQPAAQPLRERTGLDRLMLADLLADAA